MTIRSLTALRGMIVAGGLFVALIASSAARADCGDPNGDGRIVAGDALFTLRAAVGQASCALDACDVDMDGEVDTADALKLLRAAAGLPPPLACALVIKEPNDPLYPDQWGLEAIHAPEVWPTRTDCSDVIVSVVDSGIDYYHDDLVANLWQNPGEIPFNHKDDDNNGFPDDVHGWDFSGNDEYPWDPDSHGTHVSGIVGAAANSIGGVGVCWEAQIMGVRFLNEFGFGFSSDALQAIDYSRKNGATVINNSWGGGPYDSGLYFAFKAASDADIVLLVAAGNDSEDNDGLPTYPAEFLHPSQINVAAIDQTGKLATFSNYGALSVHVAAPGVDILSTVPYDNYAFFDGTSMASPMVAGAAAMLRSEFPTLSATEVKRVIMNSATDTPLLSGLVVSDGMLNLEAAFDLAEDVAFGAGVSAAASVAAIDPAPPALRGRRVLATYRDDTQKYPKLQHAAESYADGSSRNATMVADHLVVALENADAIGRIEKEGFRIRGRLALDRTTVLVETPDGTEDAAARLGTISGVESVTPDYLLSAR